ncbi:MAG: metal-sulfur cluster assembly factor [Actinomycetota bacterium]|nr:metal-sulfur cluster assembly factor [Actinomycetota bacterium]
MSDVTTDHGGWPEPEPADETLDQVEAFADVETDDDGMPTEEAIRSALRAVLDPEIGLSIVDLGLVYGVEKSDGKVDVEMTLTSLGCPLTELIHQQVTLVLTRLPGVEEVGVEFVFTPPWSTEMISDEARDELRAMGFMV